MSIVRLYVLSNPDDQWTTAKLYRLLSESPKQLPGEDLPQQRIKSTVVKYNIWKWVTVTPVDLPASLKVASH